MSQVVVITGASSGIGLAAAVALASRGAEVVLLGRHPGRLAAAVDKVRETTGRAPASFRADFAVLDEVRAVAERIRAGYDRIDVLANNAGALAGPARVTVDGYDQAMQVNHLAGFLLANLLLDRLIAGAGRSGVCGGQARQSSTAGAGRSGVCGGQARQSSTAGGRLITTASLAEAWGWLDVDQPMQRTFGRWLAYGSSKQANVLFTVEAARRWAPLGVVPTCFFPGLIRSRFASTSPAFMLGKLIPVLVGSPRRGADTLVWLATEAEAVPGGYYFMRQEFVATPRSTNPDRAERLWRASELAAGLTA